MTNLVTQLFSGFATTIVSLSSGIKDSFANLIYVDPAAETLVVSPFAQFTLVMGGLGIAMAILWRVFATIRKKKG